MPAGGAYRTDLGHQDRLQTPQSGRDELEVFLNLHLLTRNGKLGPLAMSGVKVLIGQR
jgi:hypothetical protein